MKQIALLVGFLIALIMAFFVILHFIHPVLILTLQDVGFIILFNALLSFLMALYLSSGKNSLIIWVIIGSIFPIAPMIACYFKYKKDKSAKV